MLREVDRVLDGMDGTGFRRREEVGVVGTIFACPWPFFFGRSAHGWVTSRVDEALEVMEGRMGREFDVWGMRRRAPIFACP
jgi:hypothetical protein